MNFETNKTHPNVNWRPWEYSTGPLTIQGKRKSSRNSRKHGYYRAVFREFRKSKRNPETIRIEWLCLALIKACNQDSFEDLSQIVSDISKSIVEIWRFAENGRFESDSLIELKYLFTLCESILQYSTEYVTKKINHQIKEQNEN